MRNPLFELIYIYENAPNKNPTWKEYSFQPKISENNQAYFYILKIKPADANEIPSDLTIKDWHITVFRDLIAEEGKAEASQHVTLNFLYESQPLTARASFNQFNKFLYLNCKDINNKVLATIDQPLYEQIFQYLNHIAINFYKKIFEAYAELHSNDMNIHDKLLNELTEISKNLTHEGLLQKIDPWKSYHKKLTEIFEHIEKWYRYELEPNMSRFNYLRTLKKHVENKISELNNIQLTISLKKGEENIKEEKQEIEELPPVIESFQIKDNHKEELIKINKELDQLSKKPKPTIDDLIKEYGLQNCKFELIKDDDQALDCILRIITLQKMALSKFISLLLPPNVKEYNEISDDSLNKLLTMIPSLTLKQVNLIILNNKARALNIAIKNHNINLNEAIPHEKTIEPITLFGKKVAIFEDKSYLNFAYDKHHTELFKTLLKGGAYPDEIINQLTLLMRACGERRQEEIIALLQAGASNFIKFSGHTAFGILTMEANNKPTPELVNNFIEHCKHFNINALQGKTNQRGTALSFACQNNWLDLVKLYLEKGANPAIPRESDHLTCLQIAAAKGYTNICELILQNASDETKEGCLTALQLASQFEHSDTVRYLTNYMLENNIESKQFIVSFKM